MITLPNNLISLTQGLQSATGALQADLSLTDQLILNHARGLMVGVTGDVKVSFIDDTVCILPSLIPGLIYPINITKIWKVGTTAAFIVVLY